MNIQSLEKKILALVKKEWPDKLGAVKEKLKIELPDMQFGDYSTNVLFLLAKELRASPQEIYEQLRPALEAWEETERVTFVNGYLNFFANRKSLFEDFRALLKKPESFGSLAGTKREKVNIEYVSANPTGPLTMGNGRGATIGDALAKILAKAGQSVTREYYVNDRGEQIKNFGLSMLAHLGMVPFGENFYQGAYVKELAEENKGLCIKFKDQPEYLGYIMAKRMIEFQIKPTLKRFGTRFDTFFSEKRLYKDTSSKHFFTQSAGHHEAGVEEIVLEKLRKKRLLAERDGALWLLLTKVGQPKDEVLVKKTGEPTYFFSDILYHYNKFVERRFKKAFTIIGADHFDHARRLREAMKIFGINPKNFLIIVYQLIMVKSGEERVRMSKRKGVFTTLDDLVREVGVEPVRFFFLSRPPETHIEFDIELAKKESEENPAWYFQYASARIYSIFQKAGNDYVVAKRDLKKADPKKTFEAIASDEEKIKLLRVMHRFTDTVAILSRTYQANQIVTYAMTFTKAFHGFYEKSVILDSDPAQRRHNLLFLVAVQGFLSVLFDLLSFEPRKKL